MNDGPEPAEGRPEPHAVTDALGRPIPYEGEHRVWLADPDTSTAPEGWIHLVTAREACFLLETGRVVELRGEQELGDGADRHEFGTGAHVSAYIAARGENDGPDLSPRDGLELEGAGGDRPTHASASLTDALGRPILAEGPLRVWLDDDLEDRKAPEGYIHLRTAREVCFLLESGRVEALSLDNDLDAEKPDEDKTEAEKAHLRFGEGVQVVNFLDDQQGYYERSLWPREELQLHTGNVAAREKMALTLATAGKRHAIAVEELTPRGTKRVFVFGRG